VARIKDASVEAVKSTADMVQVVQTRTQLRKAGARWTGRCPFHDEKTPSFSVNAVDKLFYCFGCGKGGDLISFVRETEGLDFAGAIEWLGERFNVPVEYDESSPQAEVERRVRDRLLALLEQATAFYERYLWDSAAGEPVRTYLVTRGVSEETAKAFRLGLSPTGSTLSRKAREKGFSPAELAEAGLTNRSGSDRFAGRLMFPLADARGRVVGFSARKLRQDDPLSGKYVNSSEGELFHKSAILYGLHLARPAIAKQDRAVVVEGQMDVIALHQSGLEPVVASMGTALTERQVKELARVTRRLYLCFDADSAGEAATLRGMELAVGQGFDPFDVERQQHLGLGFLRREIQLHADAVGIVEEDLGGAGARHDLLAELHFLGLQAVAHARQVRGRESDVVKAAGVVVLLLRAAHRDAFARRARAQQVHGWDAAGIEPVAREAKRRAVAVFQPEHIAIEVLGALQVGGLDGVMLQDA